MAMAPQSEKTLQKFIELARYIAAHAEQSLTLDLLAKRVHLSPSRMQRVFKSIFGVSPKKLQQAARGERFKALLRSGADITDAIYETGYGSSSRAYDQGVHGIGMTPKSYRAGGRGESLSWACRDTVLGPILMAATDRGVCFAQFGANCKPCCAIARRVSAAELRHTRGNPRTNSINGLTRSMPTSRINNRARRYRSILQGTAFQIKVWEFLLSLDDGDVISYSELARAIDRPRAVRAAASACGANRIAVLVPCHRILRGDGGLGGYRWGLERKRALLDAERARKSAP